MNRCIWFITTNFNALWIYITSKCLLNIFGKIYHYNARFTRFSDIKGFLYHSTQIFPSTNCNRILADTPCNPDNINFLKCIISYQMCRNLPCETNQWNAVIICCCNSRNQIGCSRATCHKAHSNLSC